jgi:hypothetical protein
MEEMPPAVETLVADLPHGLAELVAHLLQKEPAYRPRDTLNLHSNRAILLLFRR